jgi:hypothetical protein
MMSNKFRGRSSNKPEAQRVEAAAIRLQELDDNLMREYDGLVANKPDMFNSIGEQMDYVSRVSNVAGQIQGLELVRNCTNEEQ